MLGKDKLYHLVAGFVISIVFGLINPVLGLALAVIAGVGKEIYDKKIKKSVIDPLDAISTVLGGVLGTALAIILTNMI
ncbi:MAG: hypothetical protein PHU69_14625 [Fermentimonas sp.]|nr:hypothetical protein [Fermentimonas sp.]